MSVRILQLARLPLLPLRQQLKHSCILRTMSTGSSAIQVALAGFSTCEISDALIKLGSPHGGYIPDINMLSPSDRSVRICGPAYTVQMVLGSNKDAPKLSAHFVDTAPEGSVVVINTPDRTVSFLYTSSAPVR